MILCPLCRCRRRCLRSLGVQQAKDGSETELLQTRQHALQKEDLVRWTSVMFLSLALPVACGSMCGFCQELWFLTSWIPGSLKTRTLALIAPIVFPQDSELWLSSLVKSSSRVQQQADFLSMLCSGRSSTHQVSAGQCHGLLWYPHLSCVYCEIVYISE